MVLECPGKLFHRKNVGGEALVPLGFLRQSVGMHVEVGTNTGACGRSPTWHLPSHSTHFTLPGEDTGIISQQASEQTLALVWGHLRLSCRTHACRQLGGWEGGRAGSLPRLVFFPSCLPLYTHWGSCNSLYHGPASVSLGQIRDVLGPLQLRHIWNARWFSSSSSP